LTFQPVGRVFVDKFTSTFGSYSAFFLSFNAEVHLKYLEILFQGAKIVNFLEKVLIQKGRVEGLEKHFMLDRTFF
jgi:hypothetical protein